VVCQVISLLDIQRDLFAFVEFETEEQTAEAIEGRRRWLTPIILATQEAEIRRIVVPSQPRQIVCKTLS
jgi:hypothetical protein